MRNILREERHKKGMTQKQVADLLGISERGYKIYRIRSTNGSIEIWDKLEDIFNVHQRLLRCNSVPKDSQL